MYIKIIFCEKVKKLVFSSFFESYQNLYDFSRSFFKINKPFDLFYFDHDMDQIHLSSDEDIHLMKELESSKVYLPVYIEFSEF